MDMKIGRTLCMIVMATLSAADAAVITYNADDFPLKEGGRVPKLFALAVQKIRDGYTGTDLEGMLKAQNVPQDAIDCLKQAPILQLPRLIKEKPAIRTAILTNFETIRPGLGVTPETSDAMERWLNRLMAQGFLCENDSQKALLTATLHEALLHDIHTVAQFECLLPCINPLSKIGADINKRDAGSYTLLARASEYCRIAIVRALLAAGAEVNTRNNSGANTLAIAVMGHCILLNGQDIIQALLAAGAEVNTRDLQGNSPLSLANRYGKSEIAVMLRAAGARA